MQLVEEVEPVVSVRSMCKALSFPRSSYYRLRKPPSARPRQPRPSPPRALDADERQQVLGVLNSERFADLPPAEVFQTLLGSGTYLCSVRTMYRVLADNRQVRERRNQLRHPVYAKPELVATGPNQVWSWDVTKLKTTQKWRYYYLYVLLDIFSRYVVGWLLAHQESSELAEQLLRDSYDKQAVEPGQVTAHSDRGSIFKAKTLQQLLVDLGIEPSFSRPRVSNDNPFSESNFKTLKYHHQFPERFTAFDQAKDSCRKLFPWYNWEHHHSGIAMLTPGQVHYGHADEVLAERQRVLDVAYAAHPERFVHGVPKVPSLPEAVWINPPEDRTQTLLEAH